MAGEVAEFPKDGIDLGGKKRADVSTFKGQVYVSVREWYEVRVLVQCLPCSTWVLVRLYQQHILATPGVYCLIEVQLLPCSDFFCRAHICLRLTAILLLPV